MSGIFDLKTSDDLRQKLRRDLERLKAESRNVDMAFNFFVTAEHMLDWVYPKNASKQLRTDAKKASVILRVCSHLANGAKHFEVESPQHGSVEATGIKEDYATGYATLYATSYSGGGALFVALKGEAARELGQSITVLQLAEKVMNYWEEHPLK